MILLPEQFQMCVLHLFMGWLFGLLFSFENAFRLHCLGPTLQKILEFLFFTLFALGFYAALYRLNGGMTQIYCVILFFLGVFVYMKFYFMTFSPFITAFIHHASVLKKKLTLAISSGLAIMNVRTKLKKWRNRLGKKKRKRRRNKKKNAEKADHPNL